MSKISREAKVYCVSATIPVLYRIFGDIGKMGVKYDQVYHDEFPIIIEQVGASIDRGFTCQW